MTGFIAGQAGGNPKQASSIPSKFETTLFTGNKERDGFGTRSHRFAENEVCASRAPKPSQRALSLPSEPSQRALPALPPAAAHLPPCCLAAQNELPGPGSYEQDGKLLDTKIYSKKGLGGGFASKTVRSSAFGKASMTPAPGAYEINRRFTAPVRPGEANTSGFMPPTLRSVTVAEDPLPGPGQYGTPELGVPSDRSSAPTGASKPGEGFSSSAPRFSSKSKLAGASMPAPGQYNPALPGHSHAYHDDLLPSAAFRSGAPSRSGATQVSRMTKEQQLGVVGYKGAAPPGPGAYNSARTAFVISHRRSPQFCDSALDRWGNPMPGAVRQTSAPSVTPGPGAYHRETTRETVPSRAEPPTPLNLALALTLPSPSPSRSPSS